MIASVVAVLKAMIQNHHVGSRQCCFNGLSAIVLLLGLDVSSVSQSEAIGTDTECVFVLALV